MKEKETINSIIEKSGYEALVWLESVRYGKIKVSNGFNWLLLAEVSGSNVRGNSETTETLNLLWGIFSISVYELLAERTTEKFSYQLSAMFYRANIISHFGEIKGHYFLDSNIILEWFYQESNISINDALDYSLYFRDLLKNKNIETEKLDHNKMLLIRRIKNMLNMIQILQDSNFVRLDSHFSSWLSIKSSLL